MAIVGGARSCPPAQSVGKAHICPPAQYGKKLSCESCLFEKRLWMQVLMTKRLKFSDLLLLWSDVDRPSLKSNTMLHLDKPSIELVVMRE